MDRIEGTSERGATGGEPESKLDRREYWREFGQSKKGQEQGQGTRSLLRGQDTRRRTAQDWRCAQPRGSYPARSVVAVYTANEQMYKIFMGGLGQSVV